jgi:hypothetical protein
MKPHEADSYFLEAGIESLNPGLLALSGMSEDLGTIYFTALDSLIGCGRVAFATLEAEERELLNNKKRGRRFSNSIFGRRIET